MKRTHVAASADPIVLYAVDQFEPGPYVKPRGFWYEVDGDWRRWAKGDSFDVGGHLFKLDLADCDILKIRSVEALDAFHAKYRIDGYRRNYVLDWVAVARQYDGVEIAPYQWKRRLEGGVDWYYTWDCASGCIWQPKKARLTYIGPLLGG